MKNMCRDAVPASKCSPASKSRDANIASLRNQTIRKIITMITKIKYIVLSVLLWVVSSTTLQSQQITQVEYWFGNDFANATKSNVTYSDDIAQLDIPYPISDDVLVTGQFINYRFKDSNGRWSAIYTQPVMAQNEENIVHTMQVEYWFDNKFTERKLTTLSDMPPKDGNWSGQMTDISIPKGAKQIHYRFKSAYNTWSPIVSTNLLFNSSYTEYEKIEYWFDKDFANRQTTTISKHVGSDPKYVNLYNNDIQWKKGSQTMHYRLIDNLLGRSTPIFQYSQGMSENRNNKIVKAEYWFNDRFEERETKDITSKQAIYNDIQNFAVSLPTDTAINIRYQDEMGNWSTIAHFSLTANTNNGTYNILTLKPNINKGAYIVKEYATIHNYYQIKDNSGNPIEGVKIEYSLRNKKNQKFISTPSNENGIIDVKLPVWGTNLDDDKDDYIKKGETDYIVFSRLLSQENKELEVRENRFFDIMVNVYKYVSDKNGYTIFLGADTDVDFKPISALGFGAGLGAEGSIKLENRFENNLFQGFAFALDVNGSFKGKFKKSSGYWGNLKHIGLGANTGIKMNKKYSYGYKRTLSKEPIAYLYIFSELLNAQGKVGKNIDRINSEILVYLSSVLSNYLEDKVEENTTSVTHSTKFTLSGEEELEVGTNMLNLRGGLTTSAFTKYSTTNITEKDKSNKRIESVKLGMKGGIKGNITAYNTQPFSPPIASLKQKVETAYSINLKDERKDIDNYKFPNKRAIEIERNIEYNGGVDFNKVGFELSASKTYIDKIEFNRNLITYIYDNNPYSTGKATVDFMFGKNATNSLKINETWEDSKIALNEELKKYDYPQNQTEVNSNYKHIISKEYVGTGKYHKQFKSNWKLLKFNFDVGGGVRLYGKYPLSESYYHFDTHNEYCQINYEDLDKPEFFFAPFVYDELWEGIKEAFDNVKSEMFEKWKDVENWVAETVGDVRKWFSNRNNERTYTPNLTRYARLKAAPQKERSILTFDIPGEEKAFDKNTDFNFQYYYPGGDVLGITEQKDTFVVISDIFFLNASYNTKVLKKAPNGKFKLTSTVGIDDLSLLSIQDNTPVAVYYKPIDEKEWKNIGSANSTLSIDGLGVYALGIEMNADTEAPIVEITKEKEDNKVYIRIKDNIGVKWNSVMIIINGQLRKYEKISNEIIVVNLDTDEKNSELHINATVTDLAGNNTVKYAVFNQYNGLSDIEAAKHISLYPNPASESVTIKLANEINNEKVTISDISGKIVYKQTFTGLSTTINLNEFKKGIYFVKVGNITRKLLIK